MGVAGRGPNGHAGALDDQDWEFFGADPSVAPGLARPIGWRTLKPDGSGAWDKQGSADTAWVAVGAGVGAGVSSFNSATGAVTYYPVTEAPTISFLASLSAPLALGYNDGSLAWVASVGDFFVNKASALPVDNITVVTNAGRAGYQWVRLGITNRNWAAQSTWVIDPQNSTGLASDQNTGIDATHPLLTYSEHARRLAGAYIQQVTNVTVLGDQVSTDVPMYSCAIADSLSLAGGLIFTFPLTTALYSGTIGTYTQGAAAPSNDNGDTLFDAGVTGGSFTAAGLLATGILFKRTSSTAAYWWGAADLGTTTLRCSRPATQAGNAQVTLANGDTYSAYVLAKLFRVRFSQVTANNAVQFVNFNQQSALSYSKPTPVGYYHNCFAIANEMGAGQYNNPWFVGSSSFRAYGGGATVNIVLGGIKTGNLALVGDIDYSWNGRITIEAGQLHVTGGCSLQLNSDVALFDCTTKSGILVDYWSFLFFQLGAVCGSGNTYAASGVIWANKWSQISYLPGALCGAGSFTNATPIQLGSTSYAVAALPVNLLATLGIGIYQSQ